SINDDSPQVLCSQVLCSQVLSQGLENYLLRDRAMPDDVFEPQAGRKRDVPFWRAEATHVGFDSVVKVPRPVVAPLVTEFAAKAKRQRRLRDRATDESIETKHAEQRHHLSSLVDSRETDSPDVFIYLVFHLRRPE